MNESFQTALGWFQSIVIYIGKIVAPYFDYSKCTLRMRSFHCFGTYKFAFDL